MCQMRDLYWLNVNYFIYENNTGHGSNDYNYYMHSLEVLVDIHVFTRLISV